MNKLEKLAWILFAFSIMVLILGLIITRIVNIGTDPDPFGDLTYIIWAAIIYLILSGVNFFIILACLIKTQKGWVVFILNVLILAFIYSILFGRSHWLI